jgi:endonuclease/exonuclease/phosphatase family metal-dependent hydrolase
MSKIVSWNLNERPPGDPNKWAYLRDELHADVALLQESVVPADVRATYRPSGIAGRDGADRRWGSAVVAVTDAVTITPVGLANGSWRGRRLGVAPLDCVSRGHVSVALVTVAGEQFTVVSAYGLMEFGYASGSLLRTLADLEPLFDDPELGARVLLAGDWNIGTWWSGRDAKYAVREKAALDLVAAYGLVDCLDRDLPVGRGRLENCPCELGDDCRHIWTYKKAGTDAAYMDDYMFATPELAARLASVCVAPDWDWNARLSDHAPLVATME